MTSGIRVFLTWNDHDMLGMDANAILIRTDVMAFFAVYLHP